MSKGSKGDALVDKERVYAIPIRGGEEIRFSVVEVSGQIRADIRYFIEFGGIEGLQATSRGMFIHPAKLDEFEKGVKKLSEKFTQK